jgi:hypothetical protein
MPKDKEEQLRMHEITQIKEPWTNQAWKKKISLIESEV